LLLLAEAEAATVLPLHNLPVAVLVELFKVLYLFSLACIQLLLVVVARLGVLDLVVETHLL
jgi:hypothetical protein